MPKMPAHLATLFLLLLFGLPNHLYAARPLEFNPSVSITSLDNDLLTQVEAEQEVNLNIDFRPIASMSLPGSVLRNTTLKLDYVLSGDVEFHDTVSLDVGHEVLTLSSYTISYALPNRIRDGVFTFTGRVWLEGAPGGNSRGQETYHLAGLNGDSVDNDGDGFSEANGDCDDDDNTIHPDAAEICNNTVDEDCDGNLGGAIVTAEPLALPTEKVTLIITLDPLQENETYETSLFEAWDGTTASGVRPMASIDEGQYDAALGFSIIDSLGVDRDLTLFLDRTTNDLEWEYLLTCDPTLDQRLLDAKEQTIYAPYYNVDAEAHKGAGALLYGKLLFDVDGQLSTVTAYNVPPDGKVDPALDDNRISLDWNDSYYSFPTNFYGVSEDTQVQFNLGAEYAGVESDIPQVLVSDLGALAGNTAGAPYITSQTYWFDVYDLNGLQLSGDGRPASSDSLTVTGFSHNGIRTISTYYVNSKQQVQQFLTTLGRNFGATATIDSQGRLVLTDRNEGESGLYIESLAVDGSGDPIGVPSDDNANPFGETGVNSDSVLNLYTSRRKVYSQGHMVSANGVSAYTSPSTLWTSIYDENWSGRPVADGDQFVFTGFTGQGSAVTATFTVETGITSSSTGTVQDMLDFLEEEFHCYASIDGAGRLVLTDWVADGHLSNTYASQLAINSVVSSGRSNPWDDTGRVLPAAGSSFYTLDADSSDDTDSSQMGGRVSELFRAETMATTLFAEEMCQCGTSLEVGCWLSEMDEDFDGYSPAEGDCDDTDDSIHPLAEEICDNQVDEDCDGRLGGSVVSTESSGTQTELVTVITTLSPLAENEVNEENLFDSWFGTNAAEFPATTPLDQAHYETSVSLTVTDSLGGERDLTLYLDRTVNDLQWEFLMTCDPEQDLRRLESRELSIYAPDTTYNFEEHKGAGALLWGIIDFDTSGQIIGMTAYEVPPDAKVESALATNLLNLEATDYYYSFDVNFTGSEKNDTMKLDLGAIYVGIQSGVAQKLVSDLGGLNSSSAGADYITSETYWSDVYDQNGLQLTGDGTMGNSDTITVAGFDNGGQRVTTTYSINSNGKVQELLYQVASDFNCMATIDSFGRLVMTDLTSGPSGMYVESVVVDGAGDPTGSPTDDNANPFGESGMNTDSVLNVTTSRRMVYAQGQLLGSDGISVLTSAATTWTSIYDDTSPVPNNIQDGDVFTFTGVSGQGSAVTASFTVETAVTSSSSGTVQDLLDWLETTFDCDAALDGAGRLVLTDRVADSDSSGGYFSQLAIVDVTTSGTSNPFDDAGQAVSVAGSSFYTLEADPSGFDGSRQGTNVSWEFVPEDLATTIYYEPQCQ